MSDIDAHEKRSATPTLDALLAEQGLRTTHGFSRKGKGGLVGMNGAGAVGIGLLSIMDPGLLASLREAGLETWHILAVWLVMNAGAYFGIFNTYEKA